ncbi:hypothetical protein GGI07_000405 [Coemansia sp. Benny D115]|nr:hypothetical protein GGI07_000405 [Coemansia sp. Benny D115]
MLKGTPKFTRLVPKHMEPKIKRTLPKPNEHGEWTTPGRIELNKKNVTKMLLKFSAAASGVALIGFATYVVTTYFYLESQWPPLEEIKSPSVRNLLHLATYYERLSPNYDRALVLLEKALKGATENEKLSPNSLAVIDMKVRIAECLLNLRQSPESVALMQQILPELQRKGQSSAPSSTANKLLYRLSIVLGRGYTDAGQLDSAVEVLSTGLQVVKRMKQEVVRQFDAESLEKYTEYDNMNLKETILTMYLGDVFYKKGDFSIAETLFQGMLAAIRQHRAHLAVAPRVVEDPRTFFDEWACLDAYAMLSLARMKTDSGDADEAMPYIELARKAVAEEKTIRPPILCVNCTARNFLELGKIAEAQGDKKRALRRYRDAHEHARLNFSDYQHQIVPEIKRLESEKS